MTFFLRWFERKKQCKFLHKIFSHPQTKIPWSGMKLFVCNVITFCDIKTDYISRFYLPTCKAENVSFVNTYESNKYIIIIIMIFVSLQFFHLFLMFLWSTFVLFENYSVLFYVNRIIEIRTFSCTLNLYIHSVLHWKWAMGNK